MRSSPEVRRAAGDGDSGAVWAPWAAPGPGRSGYARLPPGAAAASATRIQPLVDAARAIHGRRRRRPGCWRRCRGGGARRATSPRRSSSPRRPHPEEVSRRGARSTPPPPRSSRPWRRRRRCRRAADRRPRRRRARRRRQRNRLRRHWVVSSTARRCDQTRALAASIVLSMQSQYERALRFVTLPDPSPPPPPKGRMAAQNPGRGGRHSRSSGGHHLTPLEVAARPRTAPTPQARPGVRARWAPRGPRPRAPHRRVPEAQRGAVWTLACAQSPSSPPPAAGAWALLTRPSTPACALSSSSAESDDHAQLADFYIGLLDPERDGLRRSDDPHVHHGAHHLLRAHVAAHRDSPRALLRPPPRRRRPRRRCPCCCSRRLPRRRARAMPRRKLIEPEVEACSPPSRSRPRADAPTPSQR